MERRELYADTSQARALDLEKVEARDVWDVTDEEYEQNGRDHVARLEAHRLKMIGPQREALAKFARFFGYSKGA